jgi:16S rRNA (cytosine1402-N4)-methyltransferase
MSMDAVHQSVLLSEVLELMAPGREEALLIDGTLGEGGHSVGFLQSFSNLTVVGLDADVTMLERARRRLAQFGERVTFVNTWFDDYLASAASPADRILLDLGISMVHYRESGRGFSFSLDEPLDMRLSESLPRSAADIVNTESERDLADMLFAYGEERLSRRFAHGIVESRPFSTTRQLADRIWKLSPPNYRHGRLHPATRTFQALRIVVNDELGRLERAISHGSQLLGPSGRLGIISFHSLEDRIVKHRFRELAAEAPFAVVTKKPITATDEEKRENPASRSAKLRVLERVEAA